MISEIPSDTMRDVMQIGYVAAGAGRFSQARQIFAGVAVARPRSEQPWIGIAVTELNANRPAAALEALQQANEVNPTSELARTFAAMAHRKLGQHDESARLIDKVLENGADPAAVSLAEQLAAHPG